MPKFLDALGNLATSWQLGIGGARLRSNAGVVEARSADNSALAGLAASQVRSPSVSHALPRQCLLNGSYDANGQPNALSAGAGLSVVIAASSGTPLTLSFAAGFDGYGCVDDVGQFTSNQTFLGLTASATAYLYVDRNATTGALSLGAALTGFAYQFKAPTSPATGFNWFDLTTFTMKTWTGSAWVPVQRVYVGEATTSASAVVSVTTYAYRGHFASNWLLVGSNTLYTLSHNVGIPLASASANVSFWTSATGIEGDAILATPAVSVGSPVVYGYQTANNAPLPWKNLQFFTRDFVMQNSANTWQTTGYYQVRISRGW